MVVTLTELHDSLEQWHVKNIYPGVKSSYYWAQQVIWQNLSDMFGFQYHDTLFTAGW